MSLSERAGPEEGAGQDISEGEGQPSTAPKTGVFRAQRVVALAPEEGDATTRHLGVARRRISLRPQPLSKRFWGLDWHDHLPRQVSRAGAMLQVGDWDHVQAFLARLFPQLGERNQQDRSPAMREAKERYFREHCDILEVRLEGETIGAMVGAPDDWSTYYCRLLMVDPHQNLRRLIRTFAKDVLFPHLAAVGVERFIGETAPTNLMMQRLFNELGFFPSGHRLTDRWGTLLRFTKFLDEEAARSFSSRYAPSA